MNKRGIESETLIKIILIIIFAAIAFGVVRGILKSAGVI